MSYSTNSQQQQQLLLFLRPAFYPTESWQKLFTLFQGNIYATLNLKLLTSLKHMWAAFMNKNLSKTHFYKSSLTQIKIKFTGKPATLCKNGFTPKFSIIFYW